MSTRELRAQLEELRCENDLLRQSVQGSRATSVPELERLLDGVVHLTGDPSLGQALTAFSNTYTTVEDMRYVRELCKSICPPVPVQNGKQQPWQSLFQSFYKLVNQFRSTRSALLKQRDADLPDDWFTDPWYYLYVQYFGVSDPEQCATANFDDLIEMLPYLESLGFKNLYILPHYESPMADCGYDVSDFTVRANLGGHEAYLRFMKAAETRGFRVATEAVFNHISTTHPWFARVCKTADPHWLSFFLLRNGREKVGEWEQGGDIYCRYRDPDGTITERVCVFPGVDRTHGLWVEIEGKTYQFYRDFHPFQVDLNLQNPDVLEELFHVVGQELNEGILGKRADAVAHWVKKPGCRSDGLPETHSLQALLKVFLRHICPRAIVIPEAILAPAEVATYAGHPRTINEVPTCSEGDLVLSFEMQAILREVTHFQSVAPFWRSVIQNPELPSTAAWFNALEHHDEIYMGFFPSKIRELMTEYLESRGGRAFRNGLSIGCRYSDALDNDQRRIAAAIGCLYLTPGVPLVYHGLEIGARNNQKHAEIAAQHRHERFKEQGLDVSLASSYDARELQRGPLTRSNFYDALREKNEVTVMVRELNKLRRERSSLRSSHVTPVDAGDISILSLVRKAKAPHSDPPLLCLVNLTQEETHARIQKWQLRQSIGFSDSEFGGLLDILTGTYTKTNNTGEHVSLRLRPFGCQIYEFRIMTESSTTEGIKA